MVVDKSYDAETTKDSTCTRLVPTLLQNETGSIMLEKMFSSKGKCGNSRMGQSESDQGSNSKPLSGDSMRKMSSLSGAFSLSSGQKELPASMGMSM